MSQVNKCCLGNKNKRQGKKKEKTIKERLEKENDTIGTNNGKSIAAKAPEGKRCRKKL